ncbi:transcriptional regulator [Streptomyces sp. A1-5]|uniref:transcriptional regulator n=1 Tax=Streptomyces sp. A1-5 TaxID=2738410 RepID=UPI001F189B0B|nr:transcriptional regulator [Streptomyces sp. A1-5]
MSGATGATEATGTAGDGDAFAALLRGLKERSGLSYGALSKRLHMSTSTLHRYCNGSAVPTDYAPVERLARVCRATPEELVELHRQWILADAARGRKGSGPGRAARGVGTEQPEEALTPDASTPDTGDRPQSTADSGDGPPEAADGTASSPVDGELRQPAGSDEPVVSGTVPSAPPRPRRRRTALIAAIAAAAVLGTVVLAVNLSSSAGGGGDERAAGVAGIGPGSVRADDKRPSAAASPSPSRSAKSGEPSASASEATSHPSASKSAPHGGGGAVERTGDAAVHVATRPYVYDSPCSQHFLVDSEPAQVGPPAGEQDAPRWATAYGAVSSGQQLVALTVQGTGKETVVLEALHVRVITKGAPLPWNDYSMGVGCGGNVDTKSFDIDLDNGSPIVTVKNGQRNFPYKTSESDPEVFYISARTKAHDVRWDLTLDWSSGDRHGTVHINDNGAPFRTSADAGRPGYDYPLGGSEWIRRET